MSLNIRSKKRRDYQQTFLIFLIFFLSVLAIYFLFSSFRPSNEIKENNSKGLKNIHDFQTVNSTGIEPECLDPALLISSAGTKYEKEVRKARMLPRGSAILTNSGDLVSQGIKSIIHAVPGAMERAKGKNFQPTLQGVICSVQNSILLAKRNNYQSIAFPFVGGNIFLDSIFDSKSGSKRERQLRLAENIILCAISQFRNARTKETIKRIVFVDFGNDVFKAALEKINKRSDFSLPNSPSIEIVKGSVASFSDHKCEIIVNSFNMEGDLVNSGGVSGYIAGKTGSEKNKIQQKIKEFIREFNKRLEKKGF